MSFWRVSWGRARFEELRCPQASFKSRGIIYRVSPLGQHILPSASESCGVLLQASAFGSVPVGRDEGELAVEFLRWLFLNPSQYGTSYVEAALAWLAASSTASPSC